jgi:quinolinate synthase
MNRDSSYPPATSGPSFAAVDASVRLPMPAGISRVIPEIEWAVHEPDIRAIRELKKKRNAVILAHNYQTPEIFFGVADFVGDSLALARAGARTDAEVIVLCGVHFMAETAKILSPAKTVLIPDLDAGCSLAASVTAADLELLRQRYPGVPVVTYVNTTADVKAASDICCTSANAVEVVESLSSDRVIFIPDEFLASYVALQTSVEIIAWRGHCEVHERFTAGELRKYRAENPGVQILAHPECPPEVLAEADFVGSTSGMIQHVQSSRPHQVVMLTECSMSDNVSVECPDVDFVRPCNLCPHMKRITLPKIRQTLEDLEPRVEVPETVIHKAKRSLDRMLEVGIGGRS